MRWKSGCNDFQLHQSPFVKRRGDSLTINPNIRRLRELKRESEGESSALSVPSEQQQTPQSNLNKFEMSILSNFLTVDAAGSRE